jgi:4-hydroxy-tetrahydrodipicolinate reductase
MVNGLSPKSGKMAREVAHYVLKSPEHILLPFSLTGPEINDRYMDVDGTPIALIKPDAREDFKDVFLDKVHMFVDYTHPTAVNQNADFYCAHNIPFVMGTTGGDRAALEERVKNSDTVAVIAVNMAKQVVWFQETMRMASITFPNTFKDYTLEIVESHQDGKADTSGTAKEMVKYFNHLGIPFDIMNIEKIRDVPTQRAMGVPEYALTGHGWHTYTLKSKEGSVMFQFTHNVNGRQAYAEGTLDAIRYLSTKVEAGEKGNVYSMVDVLKGA